MDAIIAYQTVFDMQRNNISTEVGMIIAIDEEVWTALGTENSFKNNSGLPAFRSSWMNFDAKIMEQELPRKIFNQYEQGA